MDQISGIQLDGYEVEGLTKILKLKVAFPANLEQTGQLNNTEKLVKPRKIKPTIIFALDVSGSMVNALESAKESIRELARTVYDTHNIFLVL